MKYGRYIHEGDSLDLEVFVDGLGLSSLHFGLWDTDQSLIVDELPKAQENYTRKLIGMFPAGTKNVLDIGAGIGDNAVYMANQNMNITCISPSPSQEEYFRENILPFHDNIKFIKSKYEEFDSDRQFEVVLMSESSNYFPIEKGLDQTLRFLKNGGFLVMGALFRKDDRRTFEEMHIYNTYVEEAKKRGFSLIEDVDVTDQAIPTIQLLHNIYKYVPPVSKVLVNYYRKSYRRKYWLLSKIASLFFREEMDMAYDILFKVGPRRTDPEQYEEYTTYRFLSFQKND